MRLVPAATGSQHRIIEFESDEDWLTVYKDRGVIYQGRDQGLSNRWTLKVDGDTLVVSGGNVKVVAR